MDAATPFIEKADDQYSSGALHHTICKKRKQSANMDADTKHPQHTPTHLILDAEDTDSFGAIARAERMVRGAVMLDSLTSLKANTGTAAAAAAGALASTAEGATT